MAVDTAAKRFSMIDMGQVFQPGLSVPDNATEVGDRLALMWLYAADQADPPVVVTNEIRRIFYGMGVHLKHVVHPYHVFNTRH